METMIIKTVNENQHMMTSLEIAEVTGKQHCHVMEAIRKMEPAWQKVNQSNFRLIEYTDSRGRLMPCYQLTKTECLYIATKFNDEARARLVLRWEELELERLGTDYTDLHGLIKSSDDNNSCNSRNSCQEKIRVNPCNPCQIINHQKLNIMSKRETIKFIVQMIASIATAIVTALGATSCMGY
jgi:Rha family phage regulatory protein